MIGEFISRIVLFVLGLIMQVINLLFSILSPLIDSIGPNVLTGLNKIQDFLTLVSANFFWVLDALSIPIPLITFVLVYLIFRGTLFLGVWVFKIYVKWIGVFWK